jgi:hypothetical protein
MEDSINYNILIYDSLLLTWLRWLIKLIYIYYKGNELDNFNIEKTRDIVES